MRHFFGSHVLDHNKLTACISRYTGMSVLDFLTKVGSHFRVNQMLAKESVKSRLTSEVGISFLEFRSGNKLIMYTNSKLSHVR